MTGKGTKRPPALTALLIAEDRRLAELVTAAMAEAREFEILSDLRGYPTEATLEIRVAPPLEEAALPLDLLHPAHGRALPTVGVCCGCMAPRRRICRARAGGATREERAAAIEHPDVVEAEEPAFEADSRN